MENKVQQSYTPQFDPSIAKEEDRLMREEDNKHR